MKPVTSALLAYLNALRPTGDAALYMADCFTITLGSGSIANIAAGQVLAYTNFDVPVALNGKTYLANSVQIDGLKYKSSIGVNVDEQTITLSAYPTMTIGGAPFLAAIQQGLLDGAEIQRDRAFFTSVSGAVPLVPLGSILLFKGRVTKIDSIGRTTAQIKVASDLTLLTIDMPRRLLQPNCVHALYDSGCTLARAAFTFSGSLGSGSSAIALNWAAATSNFQQGSIIFTSGANDGVVSTIKTATSGALTLAYPLPTPPTAGDAFTATWGCDHTLPTCTAKFANEANFLGFPYVPPPQIVTGPLSSTSTGGK